MKTALLACVLSLALPAFAVDFSGIVEKCAEEIGFKGDFKQIKTEGASTQEKCFIKCLAEKKFKLSKDGTIDMDAVKQYTAVSKELSKEMKGKVVKAFEECIKEVKADASDLCETAYKYYTCKMKKLGWKK